MLLVAWYKWTLFGANHAPPGSDGGQWLAFSHQLFGGESVRAGFQYYPPLLPFTVKLASFVLSPLGALKLVGVLTSVLIAVPVYLFLCKNLSPWFSAVLAVTATLTPFNNEILCFGGYPQLLGTAFFLLSVFCLLEGFDTGKGKWFFAASVAAAGTLGSNVLPGLLLVMTSCVIVVIWLFKLWRESKDMLGRRLRSALLFWFVPSVILALPFNSVYFAYIFTAETSPANPTGLTLADIAGWAGSAWVVEVMLWASILFMVVLLYPYWRKALAGRSVLFVYAAVAILASTLIVFLLVRELRFLAFIEIGLILMAGHVPIVLGYILSRQEAKRHLAVMLICVLGLVLSMASVGHRRLIIAYNWYDVVDAPVLSALDWLRDSADPETIIVTTGTEHGHNYGWWIEGYTHHLAYMAGDPFLFFNTTERAQVALARNLLAPETSPEEIRTLAKQNDIRYLFLEKQALKQALDDLIEAGFVERYQNAKIVIMENNELE